MSTELKVCTKCHLELPIAMFTRTNVEKGYRRGHCKDCESARVREYYAANADYRERTAANSAKWHKANPEKSAQHVRKTSLKSKYGLLSGQYEALLAGQGGCCALCARLGWPGRMMRMRSL